MAFTSSQGLALAAVLGLGCARFFLRGRYAGVSTGSCPAMTFGFGSSSWTWNQWKALTYLTHQASADPFCYRRHHCISDQHPPRSIL
jgi:hypothetical protein